MNVNSNNYESTVEKREIIEELMDKSYEIAFALSEMHNELDEAISDYEQEQSVLDQ